MADEAKVLILDVISARPAINVKDSRLWSQNSVLPPDPHNLVTERAIFLCLFNDLPLQFEAGFALWNVDRDEPTIVAHEDEDSNLHT
jgi:hypothetical protein